MCILTSVFLSCAQAWNKKNATPHQSAPNILNLIDRFNQVSHWVSSEILSQVKLRARVKMLQVRMLLPLPPSPFLSPSPSAPLLLAPPLTSVRSASSRSPTSASR